MERRAAALNAPQVSLLTRTFFARLFESDLMPDGLPQVQLILWGTILAGMPTTGYVMLLRRQMLDGDRLILVTLAMVAMGVVALLVSDNIFPDRRDARILGALPVPTHRLVLGRLAALGRLLVLFGTAICVPHSVIFGLFGSAPTVLARLVGGGAHLVTVVAACTFVLGCFVAVQCLLLLVVGRRLAQAASSVLQVLFALSLAQLVAFLPVLGSALRHHDPQSGLSSLGFPPVWFFRLYESLLGTADTGAAGLGRLAVAATAVAALLAVAIYALSYPVLTRRALEGPVPQRLRIRLWPVRRPEFPPKTGFTSPMRTAVRLFAIRTLARSRTHRMMFALYGGIALALVVSSAVSVAMRNRGAGLWQPGVPMLSMTLIFQFLLLVALRVVIAVPSEPKARWVFRACEPLDRGEALAATRDTMLVTVVGPSVLFALLQGLIFWGWRDALSHAAFSLVIGMLLAELLLTRTNKLPFACTYFPGKSRVFTLWPIYLVVFFFYTVVLAAIEHGLLLRHPGRLALFSAGVLLLTGLLAWARRRALAMLPGLLFEEEDPDAIFEGFNLSEGLAAAPKPLPNR